MEEMKLPVGRSLGKILHSKLITLTQTQKQQQAQTVPDGSEDGDAFAIPLLQVILERAPFCPTLQPY